MCSLLIYPKFILNIAVFYKTHNLIVMNLDNQLRLRHVRTFLEIARAESVSLAASRLNITQPAVSRSLRELEDMLGVRLFDRVGRSLRLNDAGRVFQTHASASMTELLRGAERLRSEGGPAARLAIGVLPTAATDLVPAAALVFRKDMPQVKLSIHTGPNGLLFNQLRDGVVDLVVGRMPEKEARAGVTFQQLYIEDVVLVCRPDHPILDCPTPGKRCAISGERGAFGYSGSHRNSGLARGPQIGEHIRCPLVHLAWCGGGRIGAGDLGCGDAALADPVRASWL